MYTRYSRWDGSQEVSGLDADELMEAMSDDLLDDGDLWRALQKMLRRGAENEQGDKMQGLRDLMEQLRNKRRENLDQYDMGGVLDKLKEQLEQVKQTEREGIDKRVQEGREKASAQDAPQESAGFQKMLERMADQKRKQLDQLPPDMPGQIRDLQNYDFMDADARQQFEDLLNALKQQMMQSTFQGMQQAIQNTTPEAMQGMKQMLSDLNQMLREAAEGGNPDFDGFMDKWGELFPGAQNLEQLAAQLQAQMAAMQSMLDSMSPSQRRELQQMMDAAMQDPDLRRELSELAMNLEEIMPMGDMRQRYSFRGDEPMSLQEAMKMMQDLQGLDKLERQMLEADHSSDLDGIDQQELSRLLGEEAGQALEQLKQLRKILEEAGYISKNGDSFELTPRAIRKIGQKALRDIFAQLKRDRVGRHETDFRGAGGDRTDDTKVYEFGDPFLLDLKETVMNAVERQGAGRPVQLTPEDFEVYRTELNTESSTVLMIDLSRSMLLRGCFRSAKRVAVALNSLIKGQFPRDNLYIIGFSYIAKQITPEELPMLTCNEWQYGTNMQHAFMLARDLLARHKGGNRQIIMITDGEPTAHFENGRPEFSYPPTSRCYMETLKEVQRCTRERITINTFMLERGYALVSFVDQITKINRGRAFYSTPERLGEYILDDFVRSKRRQRRTAS
ncbi:MAG: VWA domain-containing protein [Chloroflexi bacterium]|nr:VWA domain-containing protein [Chloroflexota bacterium]